MDKSTKTVFSHDWKSREDRDSPMMYQKLSSVVRRKHTVFVSLRRTVWNDYQKIMIYAETKSLFGADIALNLDQLYKNKTNKSIYLIIWNYRWNIIYPIPFEDMAL